MAETYFDIVVRAKNIVSQGFNDAIAQAKQASSAFNSMSIGGVGGSFGKLGLTVEGVKGALRLAGAAALAFKGDLSGVDQALSRLPMGMGEVYQAGRDLAGVLFEVDKQAAYAARVDRWDKMAATLAEVSRQAQGVSLRLQVGDFARQRLDVQDRIRDQINKVKSDLKSFLETELKIDVGSGDPTQIDTPNFDGFQAIITARRAIGDLQRQQAAELSAIGEAELKQVADRFNQRQDAANKIEQRQRQNARSLAEETERYDEEIARMRAENAEQQLRQAGRLLEADKARNAEQARASLSRARSDEERRLILERQALADAAAEADDKKRREGASKKDKSIGFDLVEVTSRVSGFAAMQRAGWEQAFDKHAGRMEGALAQVKGVCGQIVQAVKERRIEGIAFGF